MANGNFVTCRALLKCPAHATVSILVNIEASVYFVLLRCQQHIHMPFLADLQLPGDRPTAAWRRQINAFIGNYTFTGRCGPRVLRLMLQGSLRWVSVWWGHMPRGARSLLCRKHAEGNILIGRFGRIGRYGATAQFTYLGWVLCVLLTSDLTFRAFFASKWKSTVHNFFA